MSHPAPGLAGDLLTHSLIAQVTQCLGGLAQVPWYMVLAKPSGSVEAYPRTEDLVAFEIPPGVFVKMEQGTWHAGAHASQSWRFRGMQWVAWA